jgi:protein involved in polysaccharide export with SLBB domain
MNKASALGLLMLALMLSSAAAQSPAGAANKDSNTLANGSAQNRSQTAEIAKTQKADPTANSEKSNPASANVAAIPGDESLTAVYRVGVGDVLDLRVRNLPLNGSTLFTVLDGGFIDFPVISEMIPVAGLTTEEIQTRVANEFKRRALHEDAQVTVGVRQYASHSVIVTGLVVSGGTRILRREAVPLYVVMAETQSRLDAARATIMRANSPSLSVDLNDPASAAVLVRPGDIITVTARPEQFYYIGGRINYPGQKTYQPGITLVQSILAAGGLTRQTAGTVEMSREGAAGNLITNKFNLKEIKSGKVPDPKLQPGDRIEVLR